MRWKRPGSSRPASARACCADGARELMPAAEQRAAEPGFLRSSRRGRDRSSLAPLAITVALRRHAGRRRFTLTPEGAVLRREGRDLPTDRGCRDRGSASEALRPPISSAARPRPGRPRAGCFRARRAARSISATVLAAVGLLAVEQPQRGPCCKTRSGPTSPANVQEAENVLRFQQIELQQLIPADLPDGNRLVREAKERARAIPVGRSRCVEVRGVASDRAFKERCRDEGTLTTYINLGYKTWAETRDALDEIVAAGRGAIPARPGLADHRPAHGAAPGASGAGDRRDRADAVRDADWEGAARDTEVEPVGTTMASAAPPRC